MIEVELSNIWGSVSLPDLLSGEKDLFDAHMQLRTNVPDGPDFLGWLNAPEGVMARAMLAIGKAAEKIAELGDTLVVVGSGDAPLAAQAAIRALGKEGSVRLIFAGTSLSASAYEQLCSRLEGQDFCLLLIAQSAVDMECGVASRAVRWLLDRHYGPEARQHIFVCAPKDSLLHGMAQEEGYTFLAQPAQLGCADSALSPAALLPMAVSGIEPLSVLEGAGQAYHDYDLRAFENPVWMYAGARHALELRTRRTELLGIFEPDCMALGRWWASSTARRSCRGGYGVLPVPAELPGALDTLDAMLDGSRSAFETFLRIPLPARRRNIELDWKDYDDLGYLSGHSVGEAEGAMFDALVQTHASLDIPLIILSAGQLDAPQLGELFYFLELTAALCAATDGLNPFDRKRSSPTRAQAAALLRG
ncbi:MAG: hypothetical protein KAY42_02575 [Oscillospiraceae bacterium]|jgi:glucose-6-phosphate isomerase|nr:hypothetical protein [Oscillospiraceae bacterium]